MSFDLNEYVLGFCVMSLKLYKSFIFIYFHLFQIRILGLLICKNIRFSIATRLSP